MKPYIFTIVILFFTAHSIFAQANNSKTATAYRHTIYLEGLGAGGYGSFNYEYGYFQKGDLKLNARAGFSTYMLTDFLHRFNPDIIFPLSAGLVYGDVHNLEIGLGQMFSSISEINLETFKPHRVNRFSSFAIAGYRWQPKRWRVMVRLAYTPILQFNQRFQHWGGLSFGYKF